MSHSGLGISEEREIGSERYAQEESAGKMKLEGTVVAIQQRGTFERVVVRSRRTIIEFL